MNAIVQSGRSHTDATKIAGQGVNSYRAEC